MRDDYRPALILLIALALLLGTGVVIELTGTPEEVACDVERTD